MNWYGGIAAESDLPPNAAEQLCDAGFVASRIRPETLERIGDLAKYVLNVPRTGKIS